MSAGNRIAIVAVGAVLAILAFVALQPGDDDSKTAGTNTTPAAAQQGGAAATQPTTEPRAITVETKGGQPVNGLQEIAAKKGERLRLTFTSDIEEEIHVHGYDLEKAVAPNAPATIELTADLEGIFEIEMHGSETQVASLRVNPA